MLETAIAINDYRNKPFGPGGGTRRLHQFLLLTVKKRRNLWGRHRIDEGVKGLFSLGIVPPLSGYFLVANDNYAEARLAA